MADKKFNSITEVLEDGGHPTRTKVSILSDTSNVDELRRMNKRLYEIAQEYGSNSKENEELLTAYDRIHDGTEEIDRKIRDKEYVVWESPKVEQQSIFGFLSDPRVIRAAAADIGMINHFLGMQDLGPAKNAIMGLLNRALDIATSGQEPYEYLQKVEPILKRAWASLGTVSSWINVKQAIKDVEEGNFGKFAVAAGFYYKE